MPQWFDPIAETPEGRLLKEVRDLMGALGVSKEDQNSELAAMTPPHDKVTRGDVIAAAKKNSGKKEVKKFDASFNCSLCGANPHEECRMPGTDAQAINCKLNPVAYDSRADDMREENLAEHIDEGHGMFLRAEEKGRGGSFVCSECGEVDVGGLSNRGLCGKCNVQKSEVEGNTGNAVPMFMDVAGGSEVRSTSYTTNQRAFSVEDAPRSRAISEVFKMPAVSQTGYDVKGSSLHMHLNDGGNSGNLPNRAPVEESLADLRKALTNGQQGVVAEIADLLEQVYSRL